MWPPHSVNTWLTPACARTRATRSPPVSSAMASPSPEFLPLHGLAIEALRHQRVADAVDRLASAGDVERTTRIPPRVHEATERPLEAHPVAGRQATEPRGAGAAGRHVGAQREVPRLERRRGDRVRADRLRAQRNRDPLPGGELEL